MLPQSFLYVSCIIVLNFFSLNIQAVQLWQIDQAKDQEDKKEKNTKEKKRMIWYIHIYIYPYLNIGDHARGDGAREKERKLGKYAARDEKKKEVYSNVTPCHGTFREFDAPGFSGVARGCAACSVCGKVRLWFEGSGFMVDGSRFPVPGSLDTVQGFPRTPVVRWHLTRPPPTAAASEAIQLNVPFIVPVF